MAILLFSWVLVQIALIAGDCPRHCLISMPSKSTCCACGSDWVTTECIRKCLEEEQHVCYSCLGYLSTRYDQDMFLSCSRCHEYVNQTTGECKSCPDGCVSCLDDTFCYECINGLYGNTCNKKCGNCILGILSELRCNKVTGTCIHGCLDGYYTHLCDHVCGHCLPDDFNVVKCHLNTGYCTKGCVDSYFGRRCDKKCGKCLPDDKGAVKCDIETGSCFNVCIAGFFGEACDQKCNSNCFDSKTNTNVCDILSGKCNYGCMLGWYGGTCNETCGVTCSTRSCSQNVGFCDNGCVPGWYGGTCNETCGVTCSTRSCSQNAGFCDNGCVPGWYGDTCNETCSETCSKRACSQKSGYCDNGCISGWYGDTCNKICSDICSLSSCNQNSGFCEKGCVPGWYGDTCNETCSDTCLFSACNQNSGFCKKGCISGWYGDSCKESCSSTCYDKSCDQYSGRCYNGCASAYYGETCEFNCVDTCKERVCDIETSQCLRGCVTGYQGAFCNMSIETGADSVLVSITGSLAGVIILLIFGFILWLLRRVVIKGKRYGNLQMSTRNTAASIYDEIKDINDKIDEHRVSESHSYMEIGAAHPRSTHESVSNTRICCDNDLAGNYASTLAIVETIKDTPLVCANAINMSALHSEDNKDDKSDGDETQISSFISSGKIHRKRSTRSRKYYEIPDEIPGVKYNIKIESNYTSDDYEISISSASTSDRKAKAPEAGNANLSRQCNSMTGLAQSQTRDSEKTQNKQLLSKRNKEKDANGINQTQQKAEEDTCNTNPSGFNIEMQFETHQTQEEISEGDSDSLNYIHPVN